MSVSVALIAAAVLPGAAPVADAHGQCRGVSWDYTTAHVEAERVSCRKARNVAKSYRRQMAANCHGWDCDVIYAKGFRCVLYDHTYWAKVKCRDGSRRVAITWGD